MDFSKLDQGDVVLKKDELCIRGTVEACIEVRHSFYWGLVYQKTSSLTIMADLLRLFLLPSMTPPDGGSGCSEEALVGGVPHRGRRAVKALAWGPCEGATGEEGPARVRQVIARLSVFVSHILSLPINPRCLLIC